MIRSRVLQVVLMVSLDDVKRFCFTIFVANLLHPHRRRVRLHLALDPSLSSPLRSADVHLPRALVLRVSVGMLQVIGINFFPIPRVRVIPHLVLDLSRRHLHRKHQISLPSVVLLQVLSDIIIGKFAVNISLELVRPMPQQHLAHLRPVPDRALLQRLLQLDMSLADQQQIRDLVVVVHAAPEQRGVAIGLVDRVHDFEDHVVVALLVRGRAVGASRRPKGFHRLVLVLASFLFQPLPSSQLHRVRELAPRDLLVDLLRRHALGQFIGPGNTLHLAKSIFGQ